MHCPLGIGKLGLGDSWMNKISWCFAVKGKLSSSREFAVDWFQLHQVHGNIQFEADRSFKFHVLSKNAKFYHSCSSKLILWVAEFTNKIKFPGEKKSGNCFGDYCKQRTLLYAFLFLTFNELGSYLCVKFYSH